MRKLMWFVIGFAAACGLCAYIPAEGWIKSCLLVVCIILLPAVFAAIRWKSVRRAVLVLFGFAAALAWFLLFQRYYLMPAIALDGVTVETTVTATDYGYNTGYGTGVDGEVVIDGKTYLIRVYIDEEKEIVPGDTISGSFRCRITTSQGQEGATYHSGNGTFLLGYQEELVQIVRGEQGRIEYFAAELREQIKELLRRCFPEDVFAFTKALLLGDGSDLSYEVDTAFKLSGIRHIIAVSGLHVTILYSLLSLITFRKRFLTALVTFPVLFLFAAVAGFTASVTRACIMVGLMILAQLFRKEYDSPTALAFACLVMLVRNPLVITSVGFELSVGCVAGIQLFSEPVKSWLNSLFPAAKGKKLRSKLTNWFTSSISVTLGAMSLTTPLSAYYFGAVSLVGILTNLLTLWVVNFIFNGIVVVAVVGLFWVNGAGFLAAVIAWPIRFVLFTAKFLASLPLAAVYTRNIYITAWLVFCYILLAVFLLSRKRRPAVLMCCAVLGLCAALLASWLEPLMDHSRLTVLDVGQGQSILFQSEGKTYLVDCGGDNDEMTADIVAETLLSQGIHHLDGIILTHGDRDHAGGLQYLLTRIDTDMIFLPDTADNAVDDSVRNLTDGEIVYVADDLALTYGSTEITVFGPVFVSDRNENSLCVLFSTEKCDILITGDRSDFGERMLLREAELPYVDVLIAGHHGSKYSTSEELLRAVRPETVIISVGADNWYGHPADEVLERLESFGCEVYRTDEDGTVIFRR